MTKPEMIDIVQARALEHGEKITKLQAKAAIEAIEDAVLYNIIAKQDKYTFKFATIRGMIRPARSGFVPGTGEPIIWPEKIVAKCSFGSAVEDLAENCEE